MLACDNEQLKNLFPGKKIDDTCKDLLEPIDTISGL
jgi:hypothetical protein